MTASLFGFVQNLKNKNKCYSCKYISDSLIFDYENNVRLCPYSDFGLIQSGYDGIWLNVDKIQSIRHDLYNTLKDESAPLLCSSCDYYSKNDTRKNIPPFKYLYLSNWKNCYLNCVYCDFPKQEDLVSSGHYDILPSIKQLLDKKLINKKTKIIFECGDASIHPEFDKILFFFIDYEMKDIVINTPALRYCESVAQAIGKNMASVVVSFDCACPYIYEKVKGVNKYDIAVCNIKKYSSFEEPSEKRVILKYTLLNGINDNQKELSDWFIMSRNLGIKKLALDIDIKWYNQIKNSIPYYLKELIVFVNKISKYNDVPIEFSDRISKIYRTVGKDEIKD